MEKNKRIILKAVQDLELKKDVVTSNNIAKESGFERHTVLKHLNTLRGEGLLSMRLIGRTKVWKTTENGKPYIMQKLDYLEEKVKKLESVVGMK